MAFFLLFVLASCSRWTLHYIAHTTYSVYMLCYCGLSCQKKQLSPFSSLLWQACLPARLHQAKPSRPHAHLRFPSCSQGCLTGCLAARLSYRPAGRGVARPRLAPASLGSAPLARGVSPRSRGRAEPFCLRPAAPAAPGGRAHRADAHAPLRPLTSSLPPHYPQGG